MKSLQESILSTTKAGSKEYLANKVSELLHIQKETDFMIDDNNKVYLWSVPSNTKIDMSTWPDEIQFSLFDCYMKDVSIIVDGQKSYEKFLKCFDCVIGSSNGSSRQSYEFLPIVYFKNCKVNSMNFIHHYYCTFVFKKCQVDISNGLNVYRIKMHNCIPNLPYNFTILKELSIK